MAFNVKSVSVIDEVDFSFAAEVDILKHWRLVIPSVACFRI